MLSKWGPNPSKNHNNCIAKRTPIVYGILIEMSLIFGGPDLCFVWLLPYIPYIRMFRDLINCSAKKNSKKSSRIHQKSIKRESKNMIAKHSDSCSILARLCPPKWRPNGPRNPSKIDPGGISGPKWCPRGSRTPFVMDCWRILTVFFRFWLRFASFRADFWRIWVGLPLICCVLFVPEGSEPWLRETACNNSKIENRFSVKSEAR